MGRLLGIRWEHAGNAGGRARSPKLSASTAASRGNSVLISGSHVSLEISEDFNHVGVERDDHKGRKRVSLLSTRAPSRPRTPSALRLARRFASKRQENSTAERNKRNEEATAP
ncbi:unnamed protein product [Lota lota]